MENLDDVLKTISISKIRAFYNCPKCWYLHYVNGIEMPTPSYFDFGRKVHKAIENYHTKTYVEDEDTKQYINLYKKLYTDDYELLEEEFKVPIVDPLTGEELKDTLFVGIIDLVKDGYIIDHKTASRSWSKSDLEKDIQATGYSWAYRQLTKKKEKGIKFNIFIKPRKINSSPTLLLMETKRDVSDYVLFYDFLIKAINDIKSLKNPQHNNNCKNKNLFP